MLTTKAIPILYSIAITVFFSAASANDIAIIVHPSNNNSISLTAIKKIFLSKSYTFPNGDRLEAFQPESESLRHAFNEKVLVRSQASLRSYWARMLFSSKAKPPVMLDSVESIKRMVSKNRRAISYIENKDVDSSVKVTLLIKISQNTDNAVSSNSLKQS